MHADLQTNSMPGWAGMALGQGSCTTWRADWHICMTGGCASKDLSIAPNLFLKAPCVLCRRPTMSAEFDYRVRRACSSFPVVNGWSLNSWSLSMLACLQCVLSVASRALCLYVMASLVQCYMTRLCLLPYRTPVWAFDRHNSRAGDPLRHQATEHPFGQSQQALGAHLAH